MNYYKTSEIEKRAEYLCNEVKNIMSACCGFILDAGIEPVITETVTTHEEDLSVHRVSSTHREGRAFDMRCNNWPDDLKARFVEYIETLFGDYGAISKTGIKRIVYCHGEGLHQHMHVQVHKKYYDADRINEFKKLKEKV